MDDPRKTGAGGVGQGVITVFFPFFSPSIKHPNSVSPQMAKLSPSASEGTKGRAERGVGEAEGDQGPDQGQSNVADARPEQVSS